MTLAIVLVLSIYGPVSAADQPTYGTAVIDGLYDGEWDLAGDFFANMYEAGNPTKDLLSKAYLRYDCNSKTMFVLVLDADLPGGNIADDGAWPAREPTNAWVKIRAIRSSNIVDGNDDNGGSPTGNPPEFSWVPFDGIEGSTLEGWEGSFALDPGTYNIEIHVNMNPGGRTSSTGKTQNEIQVSVQCDEPVPNPSIDIEKSTNGQDADQAPGPSISAGDPVTWEYVVTNTGNVPLTNVVVEDDKLGVITCPAEIDPLDVGEEVTCTATGTAMSGQYANEGTVIGEYKGTPVSDQDPSHYYGEDAFQPNPLIDIEKSTNGYDADIPTGPTILASQSIEWKYEVKNIGNVPLENVSVIDDNGTPDDPSDDFSPSCEKTTLSVEESMICTASGIAEAGQYANKGTVYGDYVLDGEVQATVDDMDPSHYFGADPALDIEKSTQGFDADDTTGPFIEKGDQVYWLYSVKNTGNVDLTNVTVTDNQGAVLDCGGGLGDNVIETLLVGETKTCQALGTATVGQYANRGTAESTYTDDEGSQETVNDDDPSHYFGAEPGIDIEKCTSGEANGQCTESDPANHDNPLGAFFVEGDPVVWTYTITNTGNVALSNVTYADDQGAVLECGEFDGNLGVGGSVTCTASGTAALGQYTNEGYASGDYTVYVGPDGTPETRTTEDMDPSNYYAVSTYQPSLELEVTDFTVSGDANQFLNGILVIQNNSGDPEVTAIIITAVDFTVQYRTAADKNWNNVDSVADTCTTDPAVPFVFEGPGEGSAFPGTQEVDFSCTAEEYHIPEDATAVRVTVCVQAFNRYEKKTGELKWFCTSSDSDLP
jgi:hypothetical protein